MGKLTIGMCVYDDYEGAYFTLQSLRIHHKEVMNQVEFVIVNNNPNSSQGSALYEFIDKIKEPVQYLEYTKYSSTSIKNKVFELADTPYVLCMDCHVLLTPGCLSKLIQFYDEGKDEGNLLQGPLIQDGLNSFYTHFIPEWRGGMLGKWGTDERMVDEKSPPFEIPAQGLGLFSCRKENWLGFNKLFRGFGGEEVYIHEKYKKQGKKTLCLPFLQWCHRFVRVNGVPYPNLWSDRYRNYIIGRIELDMDIDDVDEEFSKYISKEDRDKIKLSVIDQIVTYNQPIIEEEIIELPLKQPIKQGCGCRG
jgi:hypothetical protein